MAKIETASSSLTAHERFLVGKCRDAVRDGIALEQWCRQRRAEASGRQRAGGGGRPGADREDFALDLGGKFVLPNRASGYFGSITLNGTDTSVMGCRQRIEFARVDRRLDARKDLEEFVLGEFLDRAHWTNVDGTPGGFGVERSLYETMDGRHGRFESDDRAGAIRWQELGRTFRWVLLTIKLHDFVVHVGPMTRRMDEAVCVIPLPEFVRVVENPSPEVAFEVSIGYPFIDYAPIPNFFGFGPGKFGIAVKLFSFYLTHDNRIRAVVEFAAAPRAKKVFDFYGVDPVYGGADVVKLLSLGLVDPRPLHDMMDTRMLVQHCHVHQKLMDGASRVWKQWLGE